MFRSLAVMMVLVGVASSAFAAGPVPVPEINPESMVSAIALLSGGLLLLADRVRRR